MGLGWCRRLEGIAAALEGDGSGGFARSPSIWPHATATGRARDPYTLAALDPILVEHRDRVYRDHLELPVTL